MATKTGISPSDKQKSPFWCAKLRLQHLRSRRFAAEEQKCGSAVKVDVPMQLTWFRKVELNLTGKLRCVNPWGWWWRWWRGSATAIKTAAGIRTEPEATELRGTAVTSGPGDAPQTHAARRQPPPAARLQSGRGVVQTGGRPQLLLCGQSVRAAVRHPEVSVHEESRAGADWRRVCGQQRGWSKSAELHPEDHGQCSTQELWGGSQIQTNSAVANLQRTTPLMCRHNFPACSAAPLPARLCQRRPTQPSELPAPAGPQGLVEVQSRRLLLPGPLRLRRGLSWRTGQDSFQLQTGAELGFYLSYWF